MIFEKKILELYTKNLLTRYDDTGLIRYFTSDDFPGLSKEAFSFSGVHGQTLRGNVYYYGESDRERLVIFEHGMGGGHLSYMKEIAELSKRGFTVLSYDHTGCMESDGENIGGFAQSLADLDFCIRALRSEGSKYKTAKLSVVGHSWGAFSTMNICAIHKDVTHIAAMSGFISVKEILNQFFTGILRLYVPALYRFEEQNLPDYTDYNAIDSLKNSDVKAMIIHSEDDPTVSFKANFLKMKKKLSDKENITFVSCVGKGHNPNFTPWAVKLKDAFFADLTDKTKSGYFTDDIKKTEFKAQYDFDKMSEQDSAVWDDIASFLNT